MSSKSPSVVPLFQNFKFNNPHQAKNQTSNNKNNINGKVSNNKKKVIKYDEEEDGEDNEDYKNVGINDAKSTGNNIYKFFILIN
jgi:hypothetical protein